MKSSSLYFLISQLWLMTSNVTEKVSSKISCLIMSILFLLFMIFAFKFELEVIEHEHKIQERKK